MKCVSEECDGILKVKYSSAEPIYEDAPEEDAELDVQLVAICIKCGKKWRGQTYIMASDLKWKED